MTPRVFLLALAAILFALAALQVSAPPATPRINLTAAGLFVMAIAFLF